MANQPNAEAVSDQVEMAFDWNTEVQDGHITFQVRLRRGERHSSFDINLELGRLSKPDLEQVQTILVRRQAQLLDAHEIAATIRWLLEVALTQQGLTTQEREAQICTLLLSDSAPSYKELYFIQRGKNFLRESGHGDFIEATKELFPYREVHRSWQLAVNTWTVELPKGLMPSSPLEREELEIVFLKLRHGPLTAAPVEHTALVEKWSSNRDFLTAMAYTIRQRKSPDESGMSLEHYILCVWLHNGLWLLDNEDRALFLGRICNVTDVSADGIRKAVKGLGLKGWSDFQPKGALAPCYLRLWREDEQLMYQILPRSSG
jgi:hypothetical protein